MRRFEQFGDHKARLYPELHTLVDGERVLSRSVTFQVTDACNLACTYCYQINKGVRRMSFDTAKKFVDLIFDKEKNSNYVTPENSPFIILDFIGGEPLLEIELIDKIVDYFIEKAFELEHPWATRYCISLCSNGVLYFEPEVQKFFKKHKNHLSLNITIDGDKELHDSCRIFPDGRPSYDLAVAAAKHWMDGGEYMGSKVTIAPSNVTLLNKALRHMLSLGYEEINANCVYEDGWTLEHAKELYKQMKEFSDYIIEEEIADNISCSLYEDIFFTPKEVEDTQCWCFGGDTLVMTKHGARPIKDIKIGDLVYTKDGELKPVINIMSHMADNVVKVKVSGAFETICTDNHNFFINDNGKLIKKEVKDIKFYDEVNLFQLNGGKIHVNGDIAYLVGRFIGDGWKVKNKKDYYICTSFDEASDFEKILKESEIKYSSHKNRTVREFRINASNKKLVKYFDDCGQYAHGKHLPKECFNWDKESLQWLLDGYLDADGTVNKCGQNRFNTVSYQLAQELMVVLRTLGYNPTCYTNHRAGKSIIEGREVNICDRYEVYFWNESNRSKYVKHKDSKVVTHGLEYTPVESQVVYNLTVADEHSYIANGIAVSNCGGTNSLMLSCDPDGWLFPCIRYMESSLGEQREPLRIGHVDYGIYKTKEELDLKECMNCVTRRTQTTDKCFYCPIASGCSDCAAYNYQVHGTVHSKATYICIMHQSRALANVYFWNKLYKKKNIDKKKLCYVPKEWAIPIIGEEEYNMLIELSGGAPGVNPHEEEFIKGCMEEEGIK